MPLKKVSVETALDCKYPEWLLFVITADRSGRANLMPAGWAMVCSFSPRMMAVAIRATNYTAELIRDTGEFVLAFAAQRHVGLIDAAGTCSGRDMDKFEALGVGKAPSSEVKAPLLADSPLQFECKLASATPAGDHIIFAGNVVAAHIADPPERKLENFHRLYAPAEPASG